MKKAGLSLIVVLAITTAIIQAVFATEYNFSYSEGEKPWAKPIKTHVTARFENGRLLDVPPGFFDSDVKTRPVPFAVPFNGYEVLTYSPIEANTYLPIWKKVFQKINGMSEDYFNDHIFVTESRIEKYQLDERMGGQFVTPKTEKRFYISYYYHVGWAYIYLTDAFTYSLEGVGDGITFEELDHDAALSHRSIGNEQTKYRQIISFNKLKLIGHIMTREQVKSAVAKASAALHFDVNKDMILDRYGRLAINLNGTADKSANKCLHGMVILEDAAIAELGECACILY